MEDSMAHPHGAPAAWILPGWKTAASTVAAVVIAILFVVAGVWKITDPFNAAARLEQARAPESLSLVGACLLGIAETFGGVLIFVPRFRRWGALVTGALLVFFLIYIGVNYGALRGEECNCFPWVKRAVGPPFFIGDAVMLALAFIAGWWARPSTCKRSAALVLLAVTVFSGVSYGVNARYQASAAAPARITVDGKPFPLRNGRVFLYFFDPECSHCDAAARQMSKFAWSDSVTIVAVPTETPQFAKDFMRDTGLPGRISYDIQTLRKSFSFVQTPYAIALVSGRVKGTYPHFDQKEPEAGLRNIGFVK